METDAPYTLDAPYYDGQVTVRPTDVVAILANNNGGAALVLRGGGSVRVVQNGKLSELRQITGLLR